MCERPCDQFRVHGRLLRPSVPVERVAAGSGAKDGLRGATAASEMIQGDAATGAGSCCNGSILVRQ
jgi:hypothetical protein